MAAFTSGPNVYFGPPAGCPHGCDPRRAPRWPLDASVPGRGRPSRTPPRAKPLRARGQWRLEPLPGEGGLADARATPDSSRARVGAPTLRALRSWLQGSIVVPELAGRTRGYAARVP